MNLFQTIISDNIFLGLNEIDRWDRKRTIKNETVGGHTLDVTMMVRTAVEEILPHYAYKEKLEITTDATGHDFDENFSGDVNHDVKYNEINGAEIRKALKVFCETRCKQYFNLPTKSHHMWIQSTTNKSEYSHDLIKVFDWISMGVFCKREIALGNSTFNKTFDYCKSSLIKACDKSEESMRKMCEDRNYTIDSDFSLYNQIKNLNW